MAKAISGVKKVNKNFRIAISLIMSFFILTFFYPVWERTPGGFWLILFNLGIFITFIWILARIVKELILLIRLKKYDSINNYLPLLVLIFGSGLLITVPFNIEKKLYGDVVFHACYEGTQNQATFKLRENNRFEIHYTGVFFYDSFVTGKYQLHNDTLNLDYDKETGTRFGDKVYMDSISEYLVPIRNDTLSISRNNFYFGYCKGLN